MNRKFDRQTTGGAGSTTRLALLAAGLLAASGSANARGISLYDGADKSGSAGFATYQSASYRFASGADLCGFEPAGLAISGSLTVNPTSLPLGLTNGSLGIVLDANTCATSSSSLETGTLHAVAHSSILPTRASSEAAFADVVHFKITNGASSALVGVGVHEDGVWNGLGYIHPSVLVYFGGTFGFDAQAPVPVTFPQEPGFADYSDLKQHPAWTSFQFTNETVTGFDFSGAFCVTDGENMPLFMSLTVNCQFGAICDFGNTSKFSFNLPSNVTFTSDSGALWTQANGVPPPSGVPEPAALVLAGAGMLALGALRWRRRGN